jgi:hypothetical protein
LDVRWWACWHDCRSQPRHGFQVAVFTGAPHEGKSFIVIAAADGDGDRYLGVVVGSNRGGCRNFAGEKGRKIISALLGVGDDMDYWMS